ncbi:hypothetical protein EW146_g6832 [Bondarzewia mesenterica]|uniref:XPG N-terminal domain-containing protein n=1 Tax=Bondarzewia mesenterica TaxID=1095465 RepID=A0A4S4LPE2_9AGAM|nr:hypothetical protein EW146_g6832 [Bondarzewia mesenterica]
MGVYGLTTYLRENQRVLSKTLRLQTNLPVALVVDGWSFIYELYAQSRLPWVYGGEYKDFSDLIVRVVEAWLTVGLKPYFVFDGPYPLLKFPTAISRASENIIQPALLFFRTSEASRSTPRFLRENSIIPPLCYTVCVHTLQSLSHKSVEVHFADVEGDPYAVEFAGRVHGYVTGHDSDFVILNADGYEGYIPMDEMVWTTSETSEDLEPEDDGGFTVARRSKTSKSFASSANQSARGLIPPECGTNFSLTCTVYKPSDLAAHLRLPVTLLPLLAALVGNDYTADQRRSTQKLFFEHKLTASQRIKRVADTLESIVAAASGTSQKRRLKRKVNSVMDLIDLTVDALLLRPSSSMGSGEREAIVEKTVEATLQYAIPKHEGDSGLWPTAICALHKPNTCPFVLSQVPPDEESSKFQVRSLYISAYRGGELSPKIMDMFSTGSAWTKLFLEDPDLEPTGRSIGRPIREWVYAILDDGVGLPERTEEEQSDEDEVEEDSDGDELIDVAEEDSDEDDGDPLAPLRGALQQLGQYSGVATSPPHTLSHAVSSRSKIITEYIRRGTRLVAEDVVAPSIAALAPFLGPDYDLSSYLPIQIQCADERLTFLLRLLQSDTLAFRTLPPIQLAVSLALRWVIRNVHERAESHNFEKDWERERWTEREAKAFVASFAWPSSSVTRPSSGDLEPVAIVNRNVQLVAQVSVALESIDLLSQTLLLGERVPSPAQYFSGHAFHRCLTEGRISDPNVMDENLWEVCATGLQSFFGMEKGKKGKKDRKANRAVQPEAARTSGKSTNGTSQGLFSILASMDA